MQNMQKAHAAPRCQAMSKRTGQRCRLQRCEVFVSVGCMAPAAERLRERELSAQRQVQGKHCTLEANQSDEVTHAMATPWLLSGASRPDNPGVPQRLSEFPLNIALNCHALVTQMPSSRSENGTFSAF